MALEAEVVKSSYVQIKNVLETCLDRLNSIPMFKSSMKIFIPENNLGNEASTMNHMLKHRKDLRCYWEKNDKPGVMKGKDTADEFQYILNVKMRNNAIRFDNEFFSTSKGHTAQSMKGLLKEEMQRYHIEYIESKTGKESMKITGKSGSGEQDDSVIALSMAVSHGRDILMNPRKMF